MPRLYTLGIDPGLTTGWAILDHVGLLWDHGEWNIDDVLDGIDWVVRGVNRTGEDLEICQEVLAKGKDGKLGNDLLYTQAALTRVIEDTYDVSRTFVIPGTWKNHRVTQVRSTQFELTEWRAFSQHVKDAIMIATWRMANRSEYYKPRPRFLDMPGRSGR